jgi:NAD+ kinase
VGPESEVRLEISTGLGGARLEVDGQIAASDPRSLRVSFRQKVSTLVGFLDQEPLLTGLRRRRIIIDSPRIVAEDESE